MTDEQLEGPLLSRRSRWILYAVAWTAGLVIMAAVIVGNPHPTQSTEARTDARPAPQVQTPAPPPPVDPHHLSAPASNYGTSGEGSSAGSPGTTGESTSGNSGRAVEPVVDISEGKTK
jgi:hypothetical protein